MIFPLKTPLQRAVALSLHAQMPPPPKPKAGPPKQIAHPGSNASPMPLWLTVQHPPTRQGGLRSGDWPAPRPALGSLCGPLRTVKCLRGNRHKRRRHDPLGAKNDPIWLALAYTSAKAFCLHT